MNVVRCVEEENGVIGSDVLRGYNDTMILYTIWEEPSYGYEISKAIRRRSDEKYIMKETTRYSAFVRLEKNGYIESFAGSKSRGKQRTCYRITEAGRDYYREKCQEWQLAQDVINRFIVDQF